jgi:CubicO group peptidase (beta-lactamase class C family)
MPDLEALFADNFRSFGELGATVSIWKEGREIYSLAAGWCDREKTIPWTAETPVLFWSATKGLSSACLLHALAAKGMNPFDTLVAEVWPEFAQAGKERITIAELISHRAGLPVLSTPIDVWDYEAVVDALAAEPPHWLPGEGHGYHPRTFGFLVDELVRRLTSEPIRSYFRTHFAEPLDLDLWIGVPPDHIDRIAPVFPARSAPPEGDLFYQEFLKAGSFTARAFTSPRGLHSAAALNKPEALTAGFPGFGGTGTAGALAKFYAMLAGGGVFQGKRFLPQECLAWMTTPLTQGFDRVLLLENAFSCGFMLDPIDASRGQKTRRLFGPSTRAFGHPGAGGSHAFADPEHGISFAYVMNQMEPGVLPGPKALRLVDALYEQPGIVE